MHALIVLLKIKLCR